MFHEKKEASQVLRMINAFVNAVILQSEKDDITRSFNGKIDELQAKINAYQQNPNAQAAINYDFKQKLLESKNFAKVRQTFYKIS